MVEKKDNDINKVNLIGSVISIFLTLFFMYIFIQGSEYLINSFFVSFSVTYFLSVFGKVIKKNIYNIRKKPIVYLFILIIIYIILLIFQIKDIIIAYFILITLNIYVIHFLLLLFKYLNIPIPLAITMLIVLIIFGLITEKTWMFVAMLVLCLKTFFSYDNILYEYKKGNRYCKKDEGKYKANLIKFNARIDLITLFIYITIVFSDKLLSDEIISKIVQKLFNEYNTIYSVIVKGGINFCGFGLSLILTSLVKKYIKSKHPDILPKLANTILNNKL